MSNYSDKVTWFLSEDYLRSDLTFFTSIWTCSDSTKYTSFAELSNLRSTKLSRVQEFNVERLSVDTLILSIKPYIGIDTTKSFALLSLYQGATILVARIDVESDTVPVSYERIIKITVPKFNLGDSRVVPNFNTDLLRSSESPLGEELVSVQEHHHLVQWGSGKSDKDLNPLIDGSARHLISANYGKITPSTEVTSYVYGEEGKEYNSTIANSVGKIVSESEAGTLEVSPSVSRILTNTLADIIANIMEEYLMANNTIQVLGQAIPEGGISELLGQNCNILYVDTIDSTNTRKLGAINSGTLKEYLVYKGTVTNKAVSTSRCISIYETSTDVTLTFTAKSQIALICSSVPVTATAAPLNVTATCATSASAKLYPSDTVIAVNDADGNVTIISSGTSERIDKILNGELGFKKIGFIDSEASSLWQTPSTSKLALTASTKTLSFTDIKGIDTDAGVSFNIGADLYCRKVVCTDGFYIG